MWVWCLGGEDPLKEGMAIHFSILAWRIPWTEEPGGLQSTALQSQTLLKRLSTHAVKKTKESHWQNVSVNILYSCKCFGICSWSWRQEPRMGEGCILCCVCVLPIQINNWFKNSCKKNNKPIAFLFIVRIYTGASVSRGCWLKNIHNLKVELWSYLTLCNPMNCSQPGSSVHGILQVRILEWVAFSFSRGSSWPRDQACISCTS